MFNYKKTLELESNGNILKRYTKENSNSKTEISQNEYEKNIIITVPISASLRCINCVFQP